jgi:hypothetical protein
MGAERPAGTVLTVVPDRTCGGYTRVGEHETMVREFSADVEKARDSTEFAERYAAFSHWMLTA